MNRMSLPVGVNSASEELLDQSMSPAANCTVYFPLVASGNWCLTR